MLLSVVRLLANGAQKPYSFNAMATNVDLSSSQLVAFPRASLGALRAALIRDTGGAYATFLQEAGYAGGDSVFASFKNWLESRGVAGADHLDVDAYQSHAADFFREMGWGSLTITPLHDVVAMVDSSDWAEAENAARNATAAASAAIRTRAVRLACGRRLANPKSSADFITFSLVGSPRFGRDCLETGQAPSRENSQRANRQNPYRRGILTAP